MKNTRLIPFCCSAIIGCKLVLFSSFASAEPKPEELKKIRAAVPAQARARAAKPRRLLVFSRAWGYKHSSIPYGKSMAKAMADKTGAFEVTFAEDDSYFDRDRLWQFDAVFFNNTNNEIFLPEDFSKLPPSEQQAALVRDALLKKNLIQFISGGKGLVVIHAGVASFRKWPEYGSIIGARFENHPWNAGSTITLKMEDSSHPLCQAFPAAHFEVTDEIYQFKEFDRNKLRVIYGIDTSGMDLKSNKGIRRTDKDFALGWIKNYGEGRVFYSALGHQHDIFWNETLLRHFLDGFQFALGDLPASTASIPLKSK